MIRLTETASTELAREVAFAAVGEFANIAAWDPGVVSSVKAIPGETVVGTVYDLVVSYGGRRMEMRYRVTAFEPGRRIALDGSGRFVTAVDVIEFADSGNGTLITYVADIGLTGVARLFEPFLKGRLAEIGRSAGDGLRRWLIELEEGPASD